MKKIFNKLAIVLTASSLTLPLTACVFNFYTNSATSAVIKSFTNQTSSVIKSLILGKEKNADTSQTIQDILNQLPNSDIKNQTSGTSLNSWQDFVDHWGFNNNINIKGFKPEDFFIKTGNGSLTKNVNTYRNLNNTFNQLKLILGINVADNRTLYNLIQSGNIKDTIVNFLNETKKTNPDEFPADLKTILTLLKNIVIGNDWSNPNQNAFKENIIDPITSLLNYLIDGQWATNQTTPENNDKLKEFMTSWKDSGGKPYSQWSNGTSWGLATKYYQNWNQTDYNFYRSGVLINHLFYQIGKDYQIKKPGSSNYKDRYLGDIITDSALGDLMGDLGQYTPHLLQNPAYIITIIEAIVPILKQWALNMSNISQGAKNLTFGQKYPTDDSKNSYNIGDILNNLQKIINNPDGDPTKPSLKYIIESLFGLNGNVIGSSFGYDIKLDLLITPWPLPDYSGFTGGIVKGKIQGLVNDTIMPAIKNIDLSGIFANILNIYNKWIKQYDALGEGINFDLTKLKSFLLNDTNGLITIINRDIIPVLYNIMTDPQPLDDAKYFEFYQSIGGQIPANPGEPAPPNFKENSFLDVIKKNITNTDEPFGQIIYILFGTSTDEKSIKGILDFIVDSNNQWIYDNYTKFFDVNNNVQGHTYNMIMTTSIKNNVISDTLIYNLTYKINNHTYSFLVTCKSSDNQDNFTGTKNFYFTAIELKSIK